VVKLYQKSRKAISSYSAFVSSELFHLFSTSNFAVFGGAGTAGGAKLF